MTSPSGVHTTVFDWQRVNVEAIMDRLSSAVVVSDMKGRFLYANRRAGELFGWIAEPLIGSTAGQLIGAALTPEMLEEINQAIGTGRAWEGEFELERLDGTFVTVRAAESGLYSESGQLIGVVSVVTDMTETRRSVQKLISEAEALRFLLDATTILSSALEFEECVRQLATLAVPLLGDLCLIDVLDDGAIRRVAAVHADPSRAALAARLMDYAPTLFGPHPAVQTIRSGRSLISNQTDDAFLRRTTVDDEHYRLVKQLGFSAYMSAPLKVGGRVLGALTLVSSGSGRTFQPNDLALAEELAGRAGQVVDNPRLFSEQARVARTLQAALLPPSLPQVPGMRLAAAYRASGRGNEVGGDFYDVFEVSRGRWVLAVGDVSGRGPDAAALTGLVRHSLRAAAQHDPNPAAMLAVTNRLLCEQEDYSLERFCTAACATVKPGDPMRITVAAAGHPPLMVVRGDGTVEEYATATGPALGITSNFSARAQRITIRSGELLLLYTDGLTEARNPDGSFFGEERLARVLAGAGHLSPDDLVATLVNAVDAYCGGQLKDDLSILVTTPAALS